MTIPLTPLDDRRFDDLVKELRALIPRYAAEWTDHNVADPGVMLIELFSWVMESFFYRIDHAHEVSQARLLELLGAVIDEKDAQDPQRLQQARNAVVADLRTPFRAVTADDFESLVLGKRDLGVARAKCLPGLDLETPDPEKMEAEGHVSMVIVPRDSADNSESGSDQKSLRDKVRSFLDTRRLITCRIHVVLPEYTDIRLIGEVVASERARLESIEQLVLHRLEAFFDPLCGGPGMERQGWPFGRDVQVSELFQLIEGIDGVDHVERLVVNRVDEGGGSGMTEGRIEVPDRNLVRFHCEISPIHVRAPV